MVALIIIACVLGYFLIGSVVAVPLSRALDFEEDDLFATGVLLMFWPGLVSGLALVAPAYGFARFGHWLWKPRA